MNAKCPSCETDVEVREVGGLNYLSTHDRPNGGRCYYSSKPVTRDAVSRPAAKKAAKKAPAKRAAKKAAKS